MDGFDQAKALFETAIQQDSSYIKPRIELADIYIIRKDYDAALEEILEAYKIDSGRADVNDYLATIYRLKNLNEDSLRHAAAAIDAESNSALFRYNLSLTLIAMEAFGKAENSLKAAISMNGSYWDAYIRLGEVLIAQDKKEEARSTLENLISRGGGTDQALQASTMLSSL